MAGTSWKFCTNLSRKLGPNFVVAVRNGHHMRGQPPEKAKTLEQRLAIMNYKDPTLHYRVDIGLPPIVQSRSKQLRERLDTLKRQRRDPQLENLARNKQLLIDLDAAYADFLKTTSYLHIKQIADHYGIFEHLFGDAYFHPMVPLSVLYDCDDFMHPVYFGNILKPSETGKKPEVTYEISDDNKDTLWTLVMTNPDGNFTEQEREYVHWFVGNIPGNKINEGETIVEYLQPFPPKGTGYHRMIFILYKQDEKIDFSALKKPGECLNLRERSFCTLDFYRERQRVMTPAGLAFFQSDWDSSLTHFYHNVLNMKEPIFEYDFPPPYIRKTEWFPIRQPFNLYLDKHRDPKQINKEFLMRKLKKVHPFRPPPPPLRFPNAVYWEKEYPSWLKLEIRKARLKEGRINEIEE